MAGSPLQADTQADITVCGMAGAAADASPARLDFLDGVRGCAALTVCTGHALTFSRAGMFTALPWISGLMHDAVAMFIVLSGFCLMLPVTRRGGTLPCSAGLFFARRARRILPPYYAALLFSLFLIRAAIGQKMGTVWDYALPVTKTGVLAHLLLVHNFSHALEINGPLWSIAVEWQIYFLFPLFVLLFGRWGRGAATAGVVLLSFSAFAALLPIARFGNVHPQFAGLFALGMLGADVAFASDPAARALRRRLSQPGIVALLSLVCAGVCGGLLGWGGAAHANYLELGDPLFGVFAMTLLVAFSQQGLPASRLLERDAAEQDVSPLPLWGRGLSGLKRAMEWTPLVWTGTISYSLYLIHLPLQALLWKVAIRDLPLPSAAQRALLATVGGALILAAAYGFHRVCERPFMPGRRRAGRQAEQAALVPPAP